MSLVTGKFSRFEVQLNYDPEVPESSSVLVRIDAASIDTGIDARDAHLRTDDFLKESPDHLRVIGVLSIREGSVMRSRCSYTCSRIQGPRGPKNEGRHSPRGIPALV